jgi:hypothetical protein
MRLNHEQPHTLCYIVRLPSRAMHTLLGVTGAIPVCLVAVQLSSTHSQQQWLSMRLKIMTASLHNMPEHCNGIGALR